MGKVYWQGFEALGTSSEVKKTRYLAKGWGGWKSGFKNWEPLLLIILVLIGFWLLAENESGTATLWTYPTLGEPISNG